MKGNKAGILTVQYFIEIKFSRLAMKLFLYCMVSFIAFTIHQGAFAQLSRGGKPITAGNLKSSFQWINLDDARVDEFLLEDRADAIRGLKNRRIAGEIPVSLNPEQDGTWSWMPDGTRIWRLGIRGKGAMALGIVFNRYFLEEGARLFLYDPMKKKVLGAYTHANNKSSAMLPVSYLPGDELIIQLEMPMELLVYGELQVGTVRYAYLPVFQDKSLSDAYFGRADSCNIDINCPQGEYFQGLKRSVVRMINAELCTGVLVNNTSEDGKPYIYTAAHCVFNHETGDYQPTVFYFNYESPSCDGPDGSDQFSIAGATLVSTGDTSENPRDADSLDFALLELSVTPPDSFMAYYAGWNRSKSPAKYTIAIHHPRGDVKKVTRDHDPPVTSYHTEDYLPELVKYSHWRILEWDLATTEGGSSGCPLFDQDLRVVGTLTGGAANCVNPVNDYFTKFDYAWDYYDAPTKQLKHWLDPAGTGTITLDGYDPLAAAGTAPLKEPRPRIYPNPARQLLHVQSNLPGSGHAEISVFHMAGTLVLQSISTQTGTHTLDVSQLDPGVYILRIRKDQIVYNQRFIIAR
jgi:hypothetical protein